MRLRLKALAARETKTPAPADLAARPAVLAAVADPVAARDVADLLVNFADGIVRALSAPGTPERAETLATFDAALARLEADKTLSRPDRMQALIARVDLVRIDLPEDGAKPAPAPKMPEALLAHVREEAARADREITDGYERQAVVTAAAHLLEQAGLGSESDALLKANLSKSHSPYYLMLGLAGNAKRRGDKAEALRWYREAYEKSEGPATRLQWGAGYLSALVELSPADEAAIESTTLQLWREAAALPDAFDQRSGRSLQRVGKKLQTWGQGGAPRRLDGAAARRARHALRFAGPKRRRSGRVQVPADAGGEGERLSALLAIEHLSVRFGAAPVVDDVSFAIAAGEKFALVGESGSGKSITALSVLGLVDGAETSGAIRFAGRDLLQAAEPELRAVRGGEIAMIFQEPMTALNPLHTIGAQIGEVLALHSSLGRGEARARAIELLAKTGIPEPERRVDAWPHQLSGGQRQRAMIAMALAGRPKLLIADEPTTALDVTIQAQILALLDALQAEMGLALLFITHDLNLVRRFTHRVGVMERGRLVESGPTEQVFAAPQHAYTRRLLASRPRRLVQPIAADAPRLIEAQGLRVSYDISRGWFRHRRFDAVRNATLALSRGETLGIVGESGSGKTTLGMALLALQPIADGSVALDGAPLGRRRRIAAAGCAGGCRWCSRIRSARSARA